MPVEITKKISQRAVEIARGLAPKRTGAGAAALRPTSQEGEIGIEIPVDVQYMVYQNDGIKPYIMNDLAGKTIAIRNGDGSINFRRATEANIGQKKITSRDEKGRIVKSKISWRYPGLQGSHFVEKSLKQATNEWVQSMNGQEVIKMLDESDVSYLMDILKGKS